MKMSTTLPAYDTKKNGMQDIHRKLVDRPLDPIMAVVLLDSAQTLLDHVKNSRTPTLRILHIEPMIKLGDRDAATDLLTRAYRDRTSEQLELPLFEDAVRGFESPDGR